MNIGLIKKNEEGDLVFYQAYLTDIYERVTCGDKYERVTKYATVKYYKNIPHLEYVWDLTDVYFSENKNIADHMLGLIFGKMNRCNKAGDFPEETGISTG